MDLVTANDLLLTATVALLLSFIVAKLVSLATTDTKHYVQDQPVLNRSTVQSPQSKSRVGFIKPVQVTTTTTTANLETGYNTTDATVVSDSNVAGELPPPTNSDVDVHEHDIRDSKFGSDSDSDVVGSLPPPTNSDVEATKHDGGVATVDYDSNFAVESPTTTNSDAEETKHGLEYAKFESDSNVVDDFPTEEHVVKSDDSTEQRNDEVEEEITEESSTEKLVSAMENEVKEKYGEKKVDEEDEWEWEGIERSEVEKMFMAATEFVAEKGYIGNCDDDDSEMELYGLNKVAMEGPCRESQPMPLKLSARAKWNAWQKLGNMSPEVAMERYISLVSDKVPGWMKVSESAADLSSALSHQQMTAAERELVQESGAQELIPPTESDSESNVRF